MFVATVHAQVFFKSWLNYVLGIGEEIHKTQNKATNTKDGGK